MSKRVSLSFEVFPAKSPGAADRLTEAISGLSRFEPDFVSVTYGAGGTTKDGTVGMLRRLATETGCPVAGHLTCVGALRTHTDAIANTYAELGIKRIVALRGDPPSGVGTTYRPTPGGYENAAALVAGLKRLGDFDISVAAYPEKHPESASVEKDIDMLAAKADAGANRAITQFFFDNSAFYRYRDRAAARGIDMPIVPGIMPIVNFTQVSRFARTCGTTIPQRLTNAFASVDETDDRASFEVSLGLAIGQVDDLYRNGVRSFHIFTMNRAPLTEGLCKWIRVHSIGGAEAAAVA